LRYLWALLFFSNALPAFGAAPRFTDVTRAAGIDFVNISGGTDKQYLIETQSAGGGFGAATSMAVSTSFSPAAPAPIRRRVPRSTAMSALALSPT